MRNIIWLLLVITPLYLFAQSEKSTIKFGIKAGVGAASIRQGGLKDADVRVRTSFGSMVQFIADIPIAKNTSVVLGAGAARRTIRYVVNSQGATFTQSTSDGFVTFSALAKRQFSSKWQISAGPEIGGNIGVLYVPILIDPPVVVAKIALNGVVEGSRRINDKTTLGVRLQHGIFPESTYIMTDNNPALRKTKR